MLIALAAAPHAMWGQSSWPNYPNNSAITVTSSGNVGISTSTPSALLSLGAQVFDYSLLRYDSPSYPYGFGIRNAQMLQYVAPGASITFGHMSAVPVGTFTEAFRIGPTGNVGIGTTNPANRLSVAGTVQAYEVLVNTGWSDYVFSPAYRLAPLSETAAYIRDHHHLPGIPSAAEVQEKGVSLGEMESKLLAKIEELTLHSIDQERECRALRERLARLEKATGGTLRPAR